MAQRGSHESLEYLVKIYGVEGINVNLEDNFRNSPLVIAIELRHQQFVERMIHHFSQTINLKALIWPENRAAKRAQQNMIIGNLFGGGGMAQQQQDDEQSDLEQMEAVMLNKAMFPDANGNKKKKNDEGTNVFRHIIKNNLQQFEKFFIEKAKYDRIQLVVDYICEGQIGKLFQVIDTHFKDAEGAKGSILIQRNQKGQSLIHVLSRNTHLLKEGIAQLTKFYKELIDQGVPSNAEDVDNRGRNALHFAVKGGNIAFLKYLVEVEHFDVKTSVDFRGVTPLSQLIKGDRILTGNIQILKYLLDRGADPNAVYEEPSYGQDYKCTPVIHSIRHDSKVRDNIKIVLKELLENGADASIQDSEGKDALVHAVIRNHTNTFHYILNLLEEDEEEEEKKGEEPKVRVALKKDQVDKNGKSLIHHIVNPLSFGSFENADLLKRAIESGFIANNRDNNGMTPYQYSLLQKSGVLKAVFEEMIKPEDLKIQVAKEEQEMELGDVLGVPQVKFEIANFESDAHTYLEDIQIQIAPEGHLVPCDAAGKFSEDCQVMFDDGAYEELEDQAEAVGPKADEDAIMEEVFEAPRMLGTQQYFDVYLTRVEIGKFQPGGDFIFYKMQLVLDRSRNLPILLTRWGRIGEEGAF